MLYSFPCGLQATQLAELSKQENQNKRHLNVLITLKAYIPSSFKLIKGPCMNLEKVISNLTAISPKKR